MFLFFFFFGREREKIMMMKKKTIRWWEMKKRRAAAFSRSNFIFIEKETNYLIPFIRIYFKYSDRFFFWFDKNENVSAVETIIFGVSPIKYFDWHLLIYRNENRRAITFPSIKIYVHIFSTNWIFKCLL